MVEPAGALSEPVPASLPPHHRNPRRAWAAVAVLLAIVLVVVALRPTLFPGGGAGSTTALSATIGADPARGYAPENVQLTAEVTGGHAPYAYTWSEGTTVLGRAVDLLVTYSTPGNESVSLTVVDADGATADAQIQVQVVSSTPQAAAYVPAPLTLDTVTLTVRWHSTSTVSACVLEAWGTLDVPMFAQCASSGGATGQGTGSAVAFEPDPDDPEVTPVLFQSPSSGVTISVGWWYNTTSTSVTSGSVTATTAVLAL